MEALSTITTTGRYFDRALDLLQPTMLPCAVALGGAVGAHLVGSTHPAGGALTVGAAATFALLAGSAMARRAAEHTLLQLASVFPMSNGLRLAVGVLRQLRADLASVKDEKGRTALHLAARAGAADVLRALTPDRAALLAGNHDGCTALHDACLGAQPDAIRALLDLAAASSCSDELLAATSEHGYTALHVATSAKVYFDDGIAALLEHGARTDTRDENGRTPLHFAASQGFGSHVKALVAAGAPREAVDDQARTALYFACQAGNLDATRELLAGGRLDTVNRADSKGYTALMASCINGTCPPICDMLLAYGADVGAKTRQGATALSLACEVGQTAVVATLLQGDRGRLREALTLRNAFGETALQHACASGYADVVGCFVDGTGAGAGELLGGLLSAQDNDGITPVHKLCSSIAGRTRTRSGARAPDSALELACVLRRALEAHPAAACVLDYGDDLPLHALCYRPCGGEEQALQIACRALLRAASDASPDTSAQWALENNCGMTPLHVLHHSMRRESWAPGQRAATEGLLQLLEGAARGSVAGRVFLHGLDTARVPRPTSQKGYLSRRGAHNRLPLESRRAVLGGQHDVQGVAAYLRGLLEGGRTPRVVVCCGAGISVNCGIPDFRSPMTGMYTKPDFKRMFNPQALEADPEGFYDLVRQVFLPVQQGNFRPSYTHTFFELLRSRGMLQRIYTQNIDGLEAQAGVAADLIVSAHGSFSSARCMACNAAPDMNEYWEAVAQPNGVPRCAGCGGICRPNVVFFGEGLAPRFEETRTLDFEQADLLVVMGTSLMVYPFAGLVNDVGDLVPRLLVNRELRGAFTKLEAAQDAAPAGDTAAYRDAAFVGDVDAGVRTLCEALGGTWSADLEQMHARESLEVARPEPEGARGAGVAETADDEARFQ